MAEKNSEGTKNAKDKKATRRPNFSPAEKIALAKEVTLRLDIIKGCFSDTVNKDDKDLAWKQILLKVNAVSSTVRTIMEIKKKYQDMKLETKKTESSNR